ncbi:hypothetical protein ACLB2K_060697 [Fragaria x ananassa]
MATYRALLSLKSSLDDSRLSALSALRLLNLSNNVFNRTFPPELSNLTNLRVLDLYNNNLTGVLPVSVATFHLAVKLVANSRALAPTRSRMKLDVSQSEVCRIAKTLKCKLQLAQFSVSKARTLPPPAIPNPIYRHSPSPHQPIRAGQSARVSPPSADLLAQQRPATPRESCQLARTYSPSRGPPRREGLAN